MGGRFFNVMLNDRDLLPAMYTTTGHVYVCAIHFGLARNCWWAKHADVVIRRVQDEIHRHVMEARDMLPRARILCRGTSQSDLA